MARVFSTTDLDSHDPQHVLLAFKWISESTKIFSVQSFPVPFCKRLFVFSFINAQIFKKLYYCEK